MSDTIANWDTFAPHQVGIDMILDIDEETNETFYVPTITIYLRQEDDIDKERGITVVLDSSYIDPFDCIKETSNHIKHMFKNISSLVYLFDSDGNKINQFDLNEIDFNTDTKLKEVTYH